MLIIAYFFKSLFPIVIIVVFFLCSLFIFYLGAVLLFLKKKNKKINFYHIFILIKKLSRIIYTLSILLNSNSNFDLIPFYSNYIIENGLSDDPEIQEAVGELEFNNNQQYYFKISSIIAAFGIGILIFYFLNNRSNGPGEFTNVMHSELPSGAGGGEGINIPNVVVPSIAITASFIELTSEIMEPENPRNTEAAVYIISDSPEAVKKEIQINKESIWESTIDSSDSYELFYVDNKLTEKFYCDDVVKLNHSVSSSSEIDIKSSSDDSDSLNTILISNFNADTDYLNLLLEEADFEYENKNIIDASKGKGFGFDLREIEYVTYLSQIELFLQNMRNEELSSPEMSLKLEMAVDSEGTPILRVLKEHYGNYHSYIDSGGKLDTPKYEILWNDLINIWMKIPDSYKKLFI